MIHCRCARCFAVPSKRKMRQRPRVLTLLSLPEDVLFHVLKGLPAEDILSLRAVHSHLKYLVDNHASVWACASFQELWPSPNNLKMFERAAESGNFEAAVKLGIAYLYNEGLSASEEGRAEVNGLKASRFFSLAESLNIWATPFIWLFIRPPWSLSGSCCKAVVYESLNAECQVQKAQKGSILYCLAKVLNLFEDEEKRKEALEMFENSSKQGCLHSSYLLWENNRRAAMSDPGRYLQSLRKLRDYAAKGSWEAQIALAKACGNGNQLGLEPKASNEMVSQLFLASPPLSKQSIFTVQKGMNETMRYILIDWLVEVATMKDFSSLCLHMTVACVDRYLKMRPVPRARLQLLGIACMVICTRFISKEILTIREAVWLTDNTYKYEDLVRMMGEIISALEGRIRIPTIVDYKEVLLNIIPLERRTVHLYSFICELSLLNTGLCVYSPARMAAAALLLAKALHKHAHPWTSQLSEITGFPLEELIPCALNLHKKCFHEDVPKDYRQVSLTAVKQRFEDERYEEIGKEEVSSYSQLCSLLGVKQEDPEPDSLYMNTVETFLTSPSGKRTKRRREDSIQEDRGSFVTTPTAELSNQEESLLDNFLDWSLDSCTGYEGDQESEGEKEGDVTAPSRVLDVTMLYVDPEEHCCQESSDEESVAKEGSSRNPRHDGQPGGEKRWLRCHALRQSAPEVSSGYSSVNSASPTSTIDCHFGPSLTATSVQPRGLAKNQGLSLLRDSESRLRSAQARSGRSDRRQAKRKNVAEYNEEEKMNLGFLSL
ncbi:cyclin-F isoform X2 [Hemicordylus capensis]|uniref:cyclin-F isoform X2 n=1 Tax=Hemicordylus capensis TaxID=884348 RepID=UPI0023038195|nr:cyclin-F isoform X2 [Hemicordylus capensis]XP_053133129.1 cyclin-F isoform X2 [Hemicordylus capensis]